MIVHCKKYWDNMHVMMEHAFNSHIPIDQDWDHPDDCEECFEM